jgi:hypothetical protein
VLISGAVRHVIAKPKTVAKLRLEVDIFHGKLILIAGSTAERGEASSLKNHMQQI